MRWRGRGRAVESVLLRLAGLAGAACLAAGQTPGPVQVGPSVHPLHDLAPTRSCVSDRVLREIKDPSSGARWFILHDASHPAGPGRMLPASDFAAAGSGSASAANEPPDVIHRGDRVVVEEHTDAAESYLESVSLGGAPAGSAFEVRLKIGGKVVRAVAMAPGRAVLMPSRRAQP